MHERKKMGELERIKEQEKRKQKIEMKKKQEKKWEMIKWFYKYIEEKSKDWEREKLKGIEDRRKKIEKREKHSRFEKIRILKEQRRSKLLGKETSEEEEDMELYNSAEATETNWGRWRDPTEVPLEEEIDEEGERVEAGSVEEIHAEVGEMLWCDEEGEEIAKIAEIMEREWKKKDKKKEEDDEKPDLEGLEELCIGCIHVPCLCLLSRLNLN